MNEEKLPSWDEMVAANRREGATPSWDEMAALEQQQTAKQNRGLAGDLVTDFKRGVQQIPGALTGLLDIPVGLLTGERMVGKGWEEIGKVTGFQPGKWADEARAEYSAGRQQANQEVDQAWERGVGSGMAATLANPGRLAGMVVESTPGMVVGSLAGRGALAAGRGLGLVANPATAAQRLAQGMVAGGVGEGAMIAGQMSDNLSDDVGGREGALASLGAGAVGAFLGVKGGQLAKRMGVVDPETAIAAGMRTAAEGAEDATQRGLLSRAGRGALAEGVFEEMPQSVQEQMWQNWAEDDPIFQGVARAGFEGALAGGTMGGAFNIPGRSRAETLQPATTPEVPYNQMPSEQPALPGMPVPETVESTEVRPAQELLAEYRELRAQAMAPEIQQRPELGQQLVERAKQLRQELGAQGVPWQVVDPSVMEKRVNTLETEIRKGLDQYKNVLLSDPDKAPRLAKRIQAMQYELNQFEPFLEQASTQGSFDFGDATTVKAPKVKTPKVKTSAPTDLLGGNDGSRNRVAPNANMAPNSGAVQGAQPVGSAGNMAPVPAVGSGGSIDAGAPVPGATASAPAGVSGLANTSLIEGTNVSTPAQMAASAAETNAAETGAPAPVDRVTAFKQSSGVKRTDKRIGQFLQELDTARDSGQITQEEHAEYEQKLADAWKQKNKAAVTAHNAVAKDYATKVQERAKPVGANLREPSAVSITRFVDGQTVTEEVSPNAEKANRGKKGASRGGGSIAALNQADQDLVRDFIGLDAENAQVSNGMSLKQLVDKYGPVVGVTHAEGMRQYLAARGFTHGDKVRIQSGGALEAVGDDAADGEVVNLAASDQGAETTTRMLADEADLDSGAVAEIGEAGDFGTLNVVKGTGANANVDAGTKFAAKLHQMLNPKRERRSATTRTPKVTNTGLTLSLLKRHRVGYSPTPSLLPSLGLSVRNWLRRSWPTPLRQMPALSRSRNLRRLSRQPIPAP